jgi:signal peptidase I
MTPTQKNDHCISSGNKVVDGLYYNLEWIIAALAGTLVFITFVMQVYRIPTGSMAETLRGNHFKLRCSQCGYRYDYDFLGPQVYHFPETYLPKLNVNVVPSMPRCPSCGFYEDTGRPNPADQRYKAYNIGFQPFYTADGKPTAGRAVSRGDQIFVLKCIYQFFEPKRWDVIVFKNPVQPQINYIKRLVALPGEKVEIIDGDIYIDDKIARKPPHVQEEMWMCVYDNDYQPARPQDKRFNNHSWIQPFKADTAEGWKLSADSMAQFSLDTQTNNTPMYLRYNPTLGNDFRSTYAYDATGRYSEMPVCSDLMMRYYVKMEAQSAAGIQLSKYGIRYEGWANSDGQLTISRLEEDSTRKVLAQRNCSPEELSGIQSMRFANVDHLLIFEYGDSRVEYDLGFGKHDAGIDRLSFPSAAIAGYGKLTVRHIRLMRDIHYRGADDAAYVIRAYEGKPLKLEAEEFFVCGDNSPNSYDARMWREPTLSNPGKQYRKGVVPADYLVGKAFFVHFPGSWRFEWSGARKIPYLDGSPEPDGIKIIYGGR